MRNEIVEYFFSKERCELGLWTLIGRHADKINAPAEGGLTPLKAAIQQGTPDEVRLLLANGAMVDQALVDHEARYHKRPEIAALMREALMHARISASIGPASSSSAAPPPPRSKRSAL